MSLVRWLLPAWYICQDMVFPPCNYIRCSSELLPCYWALTGVHWCSREEMRGCHTHCHNWNSSQQMSPKACQSHGEMEHSDDGRHRTAGYFQLQFSLISGKSVPWTLMCPPGGAFPVYHRDDEFNRAHLTFLIYCVMNQKQNMVLWANFFSWILLSHLFCLDALWLLIDNVMGRTIKPYHWRLLKIWMSISV